MVKEPQIGRYLEALESMKKTFYMVKIEKIPQNENTPTDTLARLASPKKGITGRSR